MHTRTLTAAMLTVLVTTSPFAADLVTVEDASAPSRNQARWDGAYIGAHLGYASAEASIPYLDVEMTKLALNGIIGGAYAGLNFTQGTLLYGIDADLGLANVESDNYGRVLNLDPSPADFIEARIDWNAHLRGRVGIIADNALVYVAGGLAVAGTTAQSLGLVGGAPEIIPALPQELGLTTSATHIGFTVGAGVELAMSGSVSLRAEYLYDDYGTQPYELPYGKYLVTDIYPTTDVGLTAHTLRAGISVKF